jgi:hypothetical protein
MATAKVKTEMTGKGGGRWVTRAEAKQGAKKRRRRDSRRAELDFLGCPFGGR